MKQKHMSRHALAIDIGNTSITFGILNGKRLIKIFRLSATLTDKNLQSRLDFRLRNYASKITDAIICSVVPKKTVLMVKLLQKNLSIKAKVIGKDIIVPINNLYKKPQQVGKDRLVAAYACKALYGAPAVIIDFGTATTFDYINKKGEYEGGIITPGVEITLDALFQKTALLPKVKLKQPKAFIGKNTAESIRSGVSFGLSFMCDGLIDNFKRKYGKNLKVIATGGYAEFFKKRCGQISSVNNNLILKGLGLLNSHYGK